jgi:hypothetical protein
MKRCTLLWMQPTTSHLNSLVFLSHHPQNILLGTLPTYFFNDQKKKITFLTEKNNLMFFFVFKFSI